MWSLNTNTLMWYYLVPSITPEYMGLVLIGLIIGLLKSRVGSCRILHPLPHHRHFMCKRVYDRENLAFQWKDSIIEKFLSMSSISSER